MSGPFSLQEQDISRIVFEAQLAALPAGMPEFPWERGPMRSIFGSSEIVEFPRLAQPCLLEVPGQEPPPPRPEGKVSGDKRSLSTLFEQCIFAKSDREPEEEDDKLWAIALAKWVAIFALISHEGVVGEQLQQSFWEDSAPSKEEILRDVFGPRAPRTVIKRGNSLLRCLRWHLDKNGPAWPWTIKSVSAFAESLKETKGEASAVQSLFEAVRFAQHVLGISFPELIVHDRRLQGRIQRLACEGDELKQAEVLRVEQVCALERKVIASDTCDVDKYLLGGELFALYSRSRWSDLRSLEFIRIDGAPDGSGFVEAKTR